MPLKWDANLNNLIDQLSFLYSDTDRARLAVRTAGLNPNDIQIQGPPRVFWMRIVEEADRHDRILDLIGVAESDFPNIEFGAIKQKLSLPPVTSGARDRHELLQQLDPYFSEIDSRYSELRVEQYYVPLEAVTEDNRQVSLDQYVQDWLDGSTKRHLALLGDYGTGKSYFCLRLVKKLADCFRTNPDQRPLPLLIGFRRYRSEIDLPALIREALQEDYGVDLPRPAAITRLLKSASVVLLLDGLDEMAKAPGSHSAILAFNHLQIPPEGVRVVITCRTHYFLSGSEEREVINSQDKFLFIEKLPTFDVLRLTKLSDRKIAQFIASRFGKHARNVVANFVNSTYNLSELCTRPVLLSLVCDSFKMLGDIKGPVSSANLYEQYTAAWLSREFRNSHISIHPEKVIIIIEDLAHHMVLLNTLFLTQAQLEPALTSILRKVGISLESWPVLQRQILTSTFLKRSSSESWEFTHRSFQEYFYARKFFRWEHETEGNGLFPVVHVPIWKFISQMSLLHWDQAKSLKWISKRVSRVADKSLTLTTLRAAAAYWLVKNNCIDRTRHDLTEIMLDSVDLRDADFSRCNLTYSDFHYSDLSGANFAHANLTGCDFSGSNLDGADFTGAILSRASLEYATCEGAKIGAHQLSDAQVKWFEP